MLKSTAKFHEADHVLSFFLLVCFTIDEKKKNIISKENAASELENTKDAIYVSGILAHTVKTCKD